MKKSTIRVLAIMLAVFALIIASLACGPGGADEPEAPTEAPVVEEPTDVPTEEVQEEPEVEEPAVEEAAGDGLDPSGTPGFGESTLATDFQPDPEMVALVSGGTVDTSYLGGGCTGYAAEVPDYRINWGGADTTLRMFFVSDDGSDTTMIVNDANGNWYCNDDTFDFNPKVDLYPSAEGQIDIWIGSYNSGDLIAGTLYITEMEIGPEDLAAAGGEAVSGDLDWGLEANFANVTLDTGFTPDPYEVNDIITGGDVDVSSYGSDCTGYATAAPDIHFYYEGEGADLLRFYFVSDDSSDDATLIINDPYGNWYCNDDASSGGWNPMIDFADAEPGWYAIWVGSWMSSEYAEGTFYITESDANAPQ